MKVREHGARAKYVVEHCRCDACRRANREYAARLVDRKRARAASFVVERPTAPKVMQKANAHGGVSTYTFRRVCPGTVAGPCPKSACLRGHRPLCAHCIAHLPAVDTVPVGPVAEHVRALSAKGVGYKAVADAAGVSFSLVREILSGDLAAVSAERAARILAVDEGAMADGAVVDGTATRRRIDYLLSEGWTRREISARIGNDGTSLQIRRNVRASTELKIVRLVRLHQKESADWDAACEFDAAERRDILRRCRHLALAKIAAQFPHVWPGADRPGSIGFKKLKLDRQNRSRRGRPRKL